MAKTHLILAAYRRKVAELGALDKQITDLDMTLPEGQGDQKFDLLAEKRQEIENDIKSMQEKVEFLSAWSKFKEGGSWSEELKQQLDGMDESIGDIATGTPGTTPAVGEELGVGEVPPEVPPIQGGAEEVPPAIPREEIPPAAEAAPPTSEAIPPAPMPETQEVPPPAPPPAGVQASKNSNYQNQSKKGVIGPSSKRGTTTMATDKKASLQEKLAEAKQARERISKEAKTRVAAAWTIAKTMLPTAPAELQKTFAASLLMNKTKVLTAALKQTAINAHYTKVAETLKSVHKVEMNDLLEDPSVLTKEKNAVKSEVKGDARSASAKKADDRADAGPQTDTYNDGRGHGGGTASEPKEVDAGKAAERPGAGERPGDTVNLSEGDSKETKDGAPKAAAAKSCANCKGGKQCATCKAAASKKADLPMGDAAAAPAPVSAAPPVDAMPPVEAPMGEEAPLGDMPPVEPGMGEAPAAEMVTEEKIKDIGEKVDEVLQDIKELEQAVSEEEKEGDEIPEGVLETEGNELETEGKELEGEGEILEGEGEELEGSGEELDLASIFNEDAMEEKTSALANEGDASGAEFFAPSAALDMEAALDDDGMGSIQDMFSRQGSDDDPLATLLTRSAASVAGHEVLPAFDGSLATHFEQKETSSDSRDNEHDHADDIWVETIEIAEAEDSGQKREKQDSVPALKEPKAAAKPTLKKIKPLVASDKNTPKVDIASALFSDDFEG